MPINFKPWEHATWNFLHCFVQNIKEHEFPNVCDDMVEHIISILSNLPSLFALRITGREDCGFKKIKCNNGITQEK